MKNALKFFSKKELLKIDQFTGDKLSQQLTKVAEVLLNQSILNIGHEKYRICEIEFYVFANEYKDPYAHQNPHQLVFGQWYFHQILTQAGYRCKGGKFKGLDLTLGDEKNYIGI